MKNFFVVSLLLVGMPIVAMADEFPVCSDYPLGAESYACACPAEPATRAVWGSGPYTADSDICTAALHAGVITLIGGNVLAVAADGEEAYAASSANGIETRAWGAYGASFVFDPKGPRWTDAVLTTPVCGRFDVSQEQVTCHCPAGSDQGSVWGSGPYTADSSLCAAATHAGLLSGEAGDITVVRMPGLESYEGSQSNGVTTYSWDDYPHSVVIFAAE